MGRDRKDRWCGGMVSSRISHSRWGRVSGVGIVSLGNVPVGGGYKRYFM